jgi:alkyl sulfatase BDS1-like metallo-beta-lactamase superfamily hydrolase
MTEDLLDLADKLWRGETTTMEHNPVLAGGGLCEVADRTAFVSAFGNVCAFGTDDGLVLLDTGDVWRARRNHERLRSWAADRLHTVVFSHGHIDHVGGLGPFEEEAADRGWAPPRVIAHEHVARRFDRYRLTVGYNAVINQRQFQLDEPWWPTEYRYPDETYRDHHRLDVGDDAFELHHDKGETDDATWVWNPARRVLCTGDLFIWASPNCGNPQKAQRYPAEWAAALRKMATLDAEVLLPGHGLPIVGADRVRQALDDTAELLESLVDQTLRLMNQGARLDQIAHTVRAPDHLLERPYLRPVYDEPEFVVRNIWRLYGGWYDGNPATLKPAPDDHLARELASLAGGATRLAERATQLADAGDLRLAGHLAELAALAAPDDPGIHDVRADVFSRRAAGELSTMARGVFTWAADESRRRTTSSHGDTPD